MFKCVLAFFAIVAACSATPGLLHPVATSYASRVDLNSKPILAYSAPVVKTVIAPVLKSGVVAAPLGYSYGNGLQYGNTLGYSYGHSINYGFGPNYYGYGSGAYGYGNRGYVY